MALSQLSCFLNLSSLDVYVLQYILLWQKKKNYELTLFADVSDISQTGDQGKGLNVTLGEDCGTILNSTLLDDGCAKNIQDVVIAISPIPGTQHVIFIAIKTGVLTCSKQPVLVWNLEYKAMFISLI